MAVVGVEAGGTRLELVGELAARGHDLEDAVHVRRMDPVEVDRVRVRAVVAEQHAQGVALGGPDDRAGHGAVVRPGREEDPRRDLDLLVGRDQRVLAHAARLVRLRGRRIEQCIEVVRAADGGDALADHPRVTHRRVVLDVRLQGPISGLRATVECELRERSCR